MEFLDWAIKVFSKWRYNPFILPLIFFGVLLGSFYVPLPDGISISIQTRGIVGLIISIVITAIFWRYQQPPKVKKGHVGIIIAIKSEDDKTKGRISKDFLATCKKLLGESRAQQPFQLIELNESFSELAIDNISANHLRLRCVGHLLIFGDTAQRKERGKNFYVLRLQGIVCHIPISATDQSALAQEMDAVLPLKNTILEDNELSGFEITSVQLTEATKYVIATAALLSHDFIFAISLLEEIQKSIVKLKINSNVKAIRKLIDLVPIRLADAYRFASLVSFSRWESSREKNDLQDSFDWIVKYDKIKPADNLQISLMKAIGHFVFSRDIDAAMRCLNPCKSKYISDPSWKYSAAFLEAYRNNLDNAKQFYDAAINTESGHHIPFQIEGFIAWILDIEPKNTQLNFCLGYINEIFKNDFVSARKYYSEFLNSPYQEDFSKRAIQHVKSFMAVQ